MTARTRSIPCPIDTCIAVYGPDATEFLYEHYEVTGGPTTLFVVNGELDSRFQSAHYPEAYEGEIETIHELAA